MCQKLGIMKERGKGGRRRGEKRRKWGIFARKGLPACMGN